MKRKSAHESKAKLMRAAEVWDDAQQVAAVLRQNLLESEPVVRLQIPLPAYLSALDSFSHYELMILRERVEERLAA